MNIHNFFKLIAIFIHTHRKSKTLRGALVALASITVFTTTYAMILPAITLESSRAKEMPGISLEDDFDDDVGLEEYEDDVSEDSGMDTGKSADQEGDNTDYLISDDNGISEDDWDLLLEDGEFFVDEDLDEEETEDLTEGFFGEDEEDIEEGKDKKEETEKEEAQTEKAQTEKATEKATEGTIERVAEEITEEVTEEIAEEATEEVVEEAVEEETKKVTKKEIEEAVRVETEKDTEEAAEEVTEEETEELTEVETEEETEELREADTEEEMEGYTEEAAEQETEEPAEETPEETERSTEEAAEEETEETTEGIEGSTEEGTGEETEETTEGTEGSTEEATEEETEESTEEQTEELSEALTEEETEELAEEETEELTESLTEENTEEITEEEIAEDSDELLLGSLKITQEVTVDDVSVEDHTVKSPADGDYLFEITKKDDDTFSPQIVKLTVKNGISATEEIENLDPGCYIVTGIEPQNGTETTMISTDNGASDTANTVLNEGKAENSNYAADSSEQLLLDETDNAVTEEAESLAVSGIPDDSQNNIEAITADTLADVTSDETATGIDDGSLITISNNDELPVNSSEIEVEAGKTGEQAPTVTFTNNIEITIEKTVLASDGKNYRISVTYGEETGLPEDAELSVEEILPEKSEAGPEGSFEEGFEEGSKEGLVENSAQDLEQGLEEDRGEEDRGSAYSEDDETVSSIYDEYVTKTENALGLEAGSVSYARVFDISIVSKEGVKLQPAEGSTVDVRIELADRESETLSVVHFADESDEGDVVTNSAEVNGDGSVVEFAAEGFSVYSIVDAPEPAHFGPYKLNSIEEIKENTTYLLSYGSPDKYFTSGLNTNGCLSESDDASAAANWYFEKADEDGNAYYIYTIIGTDKLYIHQKQSGSNLIELASSGTAFLLSEAADKPGTFIIKHNSENFWLQHSGGGKGIRFYNRSDDKTNARIYITDISASASSQNDPYELSGRSFGIAYHDDSATAAAMSANSKTVDTQERLQGVDMLMRADVLNNEGVLLVSESSDIQEWTFVSIEQDKYYIKTTVDNEEKYLKINHGNGSVSLVNSEHAASQIQVTPGTGANDDKWHFTTEGYSLNFSGSAANGFNAVKNSNAGTWLNLVEKSTLSEDDFTYYSARKISASDELLSATEKDENGQILKDDKGNPVYKTEKAKVIVYTRVWNSNTSKYDYYAVDHNGYLVRVYESGDKINWVGNQVNSTLWEFTEYTNSDGTPNNYYELKNTAYPDTYLAPQSGGVIANQPVGINMEGRQEGLDYTDILAWDGEAYAYSGLKVEGNKVVPCPKDEADDFYFATIVPPVLAADKPTTVETVDNNEFGISMRMINFNDDIIYDGTSPRHRIQHAFFGSHKFDQEHADTGLLSTNLTNGYPETTAHTGNAGRSLSELYKNEDMTTVNNLFIQSIYNESGYFEYDSTQNFASLKGSSFKVYNQLGAIGTTTSNTRTHGQFMPYNDISETIGYAVDTQGHLITNKTDVLRRELPDRDPRKGEPLYKIPQDDADYFFGMELSASFTQTPDGLDNWGHDIIFEFTGDDDFWFYVDGELVLDLGGIHSAMPGTVNFRTGEVVVNKTKTTLYDIFQKNYQDRGMTTEQIAQKLNEIFEAKQVNGKTVYVFRDYTTHTMKMFYMERGAGASNLKMRFNLASVQPGTVELSKKLSGTKATTNKLIQYPYQIWYRMPIYQMENDTLVHDANGNPIIVNYEEPVQMVQGDTSSAAVGAIFKGSRKLVPFKDSLTIDGRAYNNVFLLKSGETAVIKLPDKNCIYEIIECGVDTEVYEQVSVNGHVITGALYNNTDTATQSETARRKDFGTGYDSADSHPRAEYSNKVAPGAMRTLSFEKVVYDKEGHPMSPEDTAKVSARFNFRLYLGNEFADQNNLSPANMYSYYVKAPGGSYCRWDSASQSFIPLTFTQFEGSGGLEEYLSTASSAEKSAIVFTTSLNGSISNIPAGYTVEVRDLIVGTKYKVTEPDAELPKGYTRREGDGYVRTDLDGGKVVYYTEEGNYGRHPEAGNDKTAEPISDTITSKTESPKIEIRNQEGWGLTAVKEWTDKDFIIHDPIYMAVYLENSDGSLSAEPVEGSVRKLNTNETEIYWFFPDLKINNEVYTFDKFVVREVVLSGNPVVENPDTGVVTGYTAVEPKADGENISVGGKTISGNRRTEDYTVNYQPGLSTTQNENIRTDTVTNSRPGIQIYKTDWTGEHYLSGAEFTLKDDDGHDVGHASYTSNSEGLVTTAYLNEGTFTLNEIKTPSGYVAMDEPITIEVMTAEPDSYNLTVQAGTTIYYIVLSGPTGFFTFAEATEDDMASIIDMASITVKNRTVQELKVVKVGVEGSEKTPLSDVHFALYEQVEDSEGHLRPAYSAMDGYDDLVTNGDGILTKITMDLGAGTYYLREKAAPSGYKKLAEDLCFTIGEDGTVAINNSGYASWLTTDTSVPGSVSYQMTIENTPLGITIRKTDETGTALPGAKFVLSKSTQDHNHHFVAVTGYGLGENGLIDLTGKSEITFSGMANGTYQLSEVSAPSGYIILTKDIYFSVEDGAVTLTDKKGKEPEETAYPDVVLKDDNTTIEVKNVHGAALPSTGGPGTRLFYVLGTIMIAGAGLLLWKKKRLLQ